jgi:hypothetical protein
MAANADPSKQGDIDPCTDRQSAGESCVGSTPESEGVDTTVDHTPETLYLVRIAILETRVARLEARLESKERDLQHVVDRYEHVLQGRDACRDELLVSDEFDTVEPESDRTDRSDRGSGTGALDRLRRLLP